MTDLRTLTTRRQQLLVLAVNLDQELAAVESAMRIWKVRAGRPRKPYTMTPDEARAMHARYGKGERGDDVRLGHAEYGRRWRRAARRTA